MMLIAWLLAAGLSTFRPDHGVSLGVIAPWFEVPLFDQILCYFADISSELSKELLLRVLTNHSKINDNDYLWSEVNNILPRTSFPLLKAQVETGFYLPRVEMFREVAKTMGGSDYSSLIIVSEKSQPQLPVEFEFHELPSEDFDFDIVFGLGGLYVYANLQDPKAAEAVVKLIQENVNFVLRTTSKTSKFGVDLHGFGIEMRPFKYSMEYGVKDSIVLDHQSSQNTSMDDQTVSKVDGIPQSYVDMTNTEDFNLHLISYIINSGEPLPKVMRDLTANFPLFLPQIIASPITADVTRYYRQLSSHVTARDYTVLNGKYIELAHLDVFTLLDKIKKEENMINFLRHMRLDPQEVSEIMKEPNQGSSFILEYDDNNIVFLNDIEKDSAYAQWSTDIDELFRPMMWSLPRVRKNLVDAIAVIDPTSSHSITYLFQLMYFMQQEFPMRVGMLPFFSLGNPLSRKIAFAFWHIYQKSKTNAISFLVTAHTSGQYSESTYREPTEQDWADSYKQYQWDSIGWNNLHCLYDSSSKEYAAITNSNQYIKRTGIKESTVLVNGKVIPMEGTNGQEAAYELQRALSGIIELISASKAKSLSEVNIKKLLRNAKMVVPTFNAKILDSTSAGLGLAQMPMEKMTLIVNKLSEMKWDKLGSSYSKIFYIFYSKKNEEINAFKKFMNQEHSVPSDFALNPPQKLLDEKESTLIVNGRVFTDLDFTDESVYQLISIVANQSRPHMDDCPRLSYQALCMLTADSSNDMVKKSPWSEQLWLSNNPLVYVSNNNAALTWDMVIDPFTRNFQRIADVVRYVEELGVVKVRLAVLPPYSLDQTSIFTTYYRNSLDNARAMFTMLNDTTTYSVMTDMPESWVFESMKASVDLDNILLQELSPSIHEGTYVLTQIMSEGICTTQFNDFAEGSELAIVDSNGNRISDTIVMMSNGYWQLTSGPGVWNIELGGKRSKTIYEMPETVHAVHSFARATTQLRVNIRPGMEGMKVYNVSIPDTSNTTRVDVFSVASGHLYERLLKIMMLAVRRQSQYNVKFWIIKNFLSPQFKATLPVMSKKYNFSYQLVSYKWPFWLRPQFEKQRIIWGNKILFLDVLFPLDLDRVIYIDSDQIVRTDLIELMRMDFKDAPYAFTPFCDSRKETEPFRFWKQGYWKNHLQSLGNKKYHISALFAIDLQRFRKMAAGDWLRYHYQELSADPGSLANLDQDLPNYAQDHIPIYSLPQNWLWCETWCSDETMKYAKTIDLCNNPLTKAPKLHVAQTMISEWPGLDEEARNISAGPDDYVKFFFD